MEKLDANAVLHNYAKEPLARKDVENILKAAPSIAAVMNTRHKVCKENGWKEKAPSKTAFLKAVLEEPNLLRRPILVRGSKLVVGKDLDAIADLIRAAPA